MNTDCKVMNSLFQNSNAAKKASDELKTTKKEVLTLALLTILVFLWATIFSFFVSFVAKNSNLFLTILVVIFWYGSVFGLLELEKKYPKNLDAKYPYLEITDFTVPKVSFTLAIVFCIICVIHSLNPNDFVVCSLLCFSIGIWQILYSAHKQFKAISKKEIVPLILKCIPDIEYKEQEEVIADYEIKNAALLEVDYISRKTDDSYVGNIFNRHYKLEDLTLNGRNIKMQEAPLFHGLILSFELPNYFPSHFRIKKVPMFLKRLEFAFYIYFALLIVIHFLYPQLLKTIFFASIKSFSLFMASGCIYVLTFAGIIFVLGVNIYRLMQRKRQYIKTVKKNMQTHEFTIESDTFEQAKTFSDTNILLALVEISKRFKSSNVKLSLQQNKVMLMVPLKSDSLELDSVYSFCRVNSYIENYIKQFKMLFSFIKVFSK